MVLTDEKQAEFEAVAKPVVLWLKENCHPHVVVVVDNIHAALHEGVVSFSVPWDDTHEVVMPDYMQSMKTDAKEFFGNIDSMFEK